MYELNITIFNPWTQRPSIKEHVPYSYWLFKAPGVLSVGIPSLRPQDSGHILPGVRCVHRTYGWIMLGAGDRTGESFVLR